MLAGTESKGRPSRLTGDIVYGIIASTHEPKTNMRDKREQLSHWVQHPHNVRFSDFCALVESFGFTLRRTRGSHRVYAHDDVPGILNVQEGRAGKAKPLQIRQFERLLSLRESLPESPGGQDESKHG